MAQNKGPQGVGSQQIQIDATQFVLGMATSDYSNDGGFGASSYGINPKITPGVIYSTPTEVDISTNAAGNMIASAEDSQTTVAYDRLFIDDAANFYTLAGSTLTKRSTGLKTYTTGTTDMVSFAGNTYITSETDMAQWNTSSLTLTESWWVTTKSKSALTSSFRHPLLVFEQLLWLGDGSALWNIDSSGTITASNWTLTTGELITALGIDPSTNLMMVAVTTIKNYSDTYNAKNFIYLYDGYSSKPRRKIPVDEMVTAFHNVGGTVFIGYGQNIGYWNGNGISFVRKLANVTLAGSELPYKHHLTNIANTLYVVDGRNVLAFGEILPGQRKVPYYIYKNTINSSKLSLLCSVGSNKLCVAYATNKISTIDTSAISAGTGTLYTNNINFPRPVFIRRARVITTGITTTNNSGIGGFAIIDEAGNTNQTATTTFKVASGTLYTFNFDFMGLKLQMAQPRITFDTQAFGLVRVILYYDVAE